MLTCIGNCHLCVTELDQDLLQVCKSLASRGEDYLIHQYLCEVKQRGWVWLFIKKGIVII